MTKDRIIAKAQMDADRSGHTLLVFNLNRFGSLWVIREFEPRLAREPGVIVITPGGYGV